MYFRVCIQEDAMSIEQSKTFVRNFAISSFLTVVFVTKIMYDGT